MIRKKYNIQDANETDKGETQERVLHDDDACTGGNEVPEFIYTFQSQDKLEAYATKCMKNNK